MQSFLDKYITPQKGILLIAQAGYWGNTMAFIITIGQRKGLGIAAAQPLYVVGWMRDAIE